MVFLQLPQSRYSLYVLLFFQITPAALPAKSGTPCWQPLLTGIHAHPVHIQPYLPRVIVSSHCSSLGLSDNSCSTCHTLHSASERILHPVIHSASICFFVKLLLLFQLTHVLQKLTSGLRILLTLYKALPR